MKETVNQIYEFLDIEFNGFTSDLINKLFNDDIDLPEFKKIAKKFDHMDVIVEYVRYLDETEFFFKEAVKESLKNVKSDYNFSKPYPKELKMGTYSFHIKSHTTSTLKKLEEKYEQIEDCLYELYNFYDQNTEVSKFVTTFFEAYFNPAYAIEGIIKGKSRFDETEEKLWLQFKKHMKKIDSLHVKLLLKIKEAHRKTLEKAYRNMKKLGIE